MSCFPGVEKIMREGKQIPTKPTPSAAASRSRRTLERKCACGGSAGHDSECKGCKKKDLQRRATAPGPGPAPPIVHQVLRSPGEPLTPQARSFFELRFGHDFSNVRVHTDSLAAESAASVSALAYTVGDDIVFAENQYAPASAGRNEILAHELAHTLQQQKGPVPGRLEIGRPGDSDEREADQTASRALAGVGAPPPSRPSGSSTSAPRLRRVSFGNDGPLSAERKAVVSKAADIAERLVTGAGGINTFKKKWDEFWKTQAITPKPSLETYQAALKNRVVHDMESSANNEIRKFVDEEKTLSVERRTAAVTKVNSNDTYIRPFAIDQGLDSAVSLLIHESMHGAGVSMGPMQMYEPFMHAFEAGVGFPMMMGGADIVKIEQARKGETDLDVTVSYNVRQIDKEELPKQIEIQIVSTESGDVYFDEQPDGSRKPARQTIASKPGPAKWVWHARNPGPASANVRIVDKATGVLLASQSFVPNPKCVIGVSSKHCEGE